MNPGAPELLGFWFFQPDTVSPQDRTPQGLEKPEAFFSPFPTPRNRNKGLQTRKEL